MPWRPHGTAHGKVIAAAQSTSPEISVTSSVHSTAFTAASIAQFASTAIGQNVAETFTISNPAAAALVLTGNTPVAISGPQAADFQVTQPSVTAIAPGQNATFSIVFSPQGTGTRTATATIASNASGAGSFRISLKGAGLAPAIYAVRSTQFGQAAVGQTVTRTLAIYNTGTAPLVLTGSTPVTIAGPQAGDYQVKQPSVTTIAPGGHTSFTISFSPQNSGTRTATATIASNATGAGAWQVALSGTGLARVISMAGSGQFGQVMAGQKATQSFSISNRGSAMLQMTGNPLIQITGPQASDFQVTVQPYSAKIAPGWSVPVTIVFSPQGKGSCVATATITSNALGAGSFQIPLSGNGVMSAISVAGNGPFGEAAIGQSITQTYTISNSGTAALVLTGTTPLSITGPQASEFHVTQPSLTTISPAQLRRST